MSVRTVSPGPCMRLSAWARRPRPIIQRQRGTVLRPAPILTLVLALLTVVNPSLAGNESYPVSDPVLDPPTLHCLGAYWIVRGDDNANASVAVGYRKAGETDWRTGPPLFRVEKGAHVSKEHEPSPDVPADAWLFAGSVFRLTPGTDYELKLTLADPDGGAATHTLRARTIDEPTAPPADASRTYHVTPGTGGGTGTAADPFKGLSAAQARAEPGTLFLLHAGTYEGPFEVTKNGEPGRPIVWRAAGDGEAVLDGRGGGAAERPGAVVNAMGAHDVWLERLSIRNGVFGIAANEAARLVIRRCHIRDVDNGIVATRNKGGRLTGFFVTDNVIEGPSTWPRTRGIEPARGVLISGAGHVIAYNRVRGFADAIDTAPSPVCAAIDIHNNDLSELTDDGIELDGAQRNVRCYDNRLTNVFQGVSAQPVYGGPAYVLRNALYNVALAPLKLHNRPSGVLFLHNTVVKAGPPTLIATPEPFSNCVFRNNLFVGTAAPYAFECTAPAEQCDFDYDGFAGGPFPLFLKWNGVRYETAEQVRAKAPIYRHVRTPDAGTLFERGVRAPQDAAGQLPIEANDLRLARGSGAVDAGEPLPGINDGHAGKSPDLGAYEAGAVLPHYGARP